MKPNSFIIRTTTLFPSKLAAIAVVPVLALTIALIGGAFTDKAMAQQPNSNKPFAVGGFSTLTEHVAFAAQMNPKTGAPIGHVVQELATGTNSGKVMCFQTGGNTALITFFVDKGPDAGMYRTFLLGDGGEPSMGISPDEYYECGNQNNNCETANCTFQPISRGNIVVSH
jgi:hypothetical protein